MPLLVTYQNRRIKRRRRVDTGLILSFYSARRGQRGEQLFVTDEQWHSFGRVEYRPAATHGDSHPSG